MSIYVEYELRCDGASGPYDCDPAVYAGTVARARAEAKENGWLVAQPGGKDYCPRPEHRPAKNGSRS